MEENEFTFEVESAQKKSPDIQPTMKESLERIKANQKNKRKKSRLMGLCAFILAMLAGAFAAAVAVNALLAFADKTLTMSHINLFITALWICGIASAVALILSVVTYFIKKQRKGFAVAATIISLLVALSCSAGLYAYHYVFGEIDQDEEFNQLSDEELYVVKADKDGQIHRDVITVKPTIKDTEVRDFVEQKQEENPDVVIEWEALIDDDIPEEALAKMNTGKPTGESYLTGDHAKIVNFALFGLDKVGSSDSIIIFSFDRVHHKLKLISIPRDSYVKVPAFGTYAKLAYPYLWGGAQWAVGTLNYNFSMNITEYIAVDLGQLEDIIDMVGGVYVDLDYDEAWCLRQFADYPTGRNLLHGAAAVAYSRLRESSATDNEQKRTGRQREVLMSILEKVQTMDWSEYPEFIRSCLGMCKTSFDNEQLMELCVEVVQNDYTIEQHALIAYMDYWGGIIGEAKYFYVVYDLNRASDQLYRLIYEDLYISGYQDEKTTSN